MITFAGVVRSFVGLTGLFDLDASALVSCRMPFGSGLVSCRNAHQDRLGESVPYSSVVPTPVYQDQLLPLPRGYPALALHARVEYRFRMQS